jgi:hypothetical protein
MPEEANMPPAPERERGNRDAEREALRLQREAEREAERERARAEREEERARQEALRAEERALQERERLNQRTTDEIVRYSADRFADLWSNTGRGFAGLMESMLQMVRRTFARIAAEAVIRPIVTPIVSGFVTPLMSSLGLAGAMGGGTASAATAGIGGIPGSAGVGAAAGGGGIMDALGFGAIGAGMAGLLATPLFTTAAVAPAGALTAAQMANPAFAAEAMAAGAATAPGTTLTLGGALGGAAAGIGLGTLAGMGTGAIRGTENPMMGSLMGAGLGVGAGFAASALGLSLFGLGPVGMMIAAGVMGGAAGGLFGPTKKGNASRAGGDVFLGVDANGQLTITGARGKRWDQGGATTAVQEQLDAINAQTSARGLTFAGPGQSAIGFGQASGSPRELSMTGLVGQLRSGNANQMTAFGTLAGRGAGLEEALSAADFVVQVFEPLGRAVEKTSAFKSAMEQLTKAYDDAITRARDLGLSESALAAQRAERVAKLEADRARDLDIIDRTIAARRMALGGDNRGAGLTQFDLRAEAELRAFRDQLFQYGLEETGDEYRRRVVALEQTIADERLAVMREFDGQAEALAAQMRGIARGLLENLTVGDLGGLPLEARYGAALSSLSAAQRPLLDGASPEELSEFARVAQIALPIAKEFLGVSGSFAELVADVSRTLRTAAPGSDPANLGALLEAQVAGSDRLELAVISTGNMQTEVLRNLLTELRRLTAQNEALLARVSV